MWKLGSKRFVLVLYFLSSSDNIYFSALKYPQSWPLPIHPCHPSPPPESTDRVQASGNINPQGENLGTLKLLPSSSRSNFKVVVIELPHRTKSLLWFPCLFLAQQLKMGPKSLTGNLMKDVRFPLIWLSSPERQCETTGWRAEAQASPWLCDLGTQYLLLWFPHL